jgi:hypothetical protein
MTTDDKKTLHTKIAGLTEQLKALQATEKAQRRVCNEATVNSLTANMSYEEMCELREVLNERISKRWAYEYGDDE